MCYRSTCGNHVNNAELLDLLTKASNLPDVSHVLIMGDFNYAGIDWEHMIIEGGRDTQLFHENALDNLLVQHVNFNTRHRVNNNPSRLDLIFTNEGEMIENITSEAPIGLSDHVGISFELVTGQLFIPNCISAWNGFAKDIAEAQTLVQKSTAFKWLNCCCTPQIYCTTNIIRQRHEANTLNFGKSDYEQMNAVFKAINWTDIFKNKAVESMWQSFKSLYNKVITKFTPLFDPTKKTKPPWRTSRVNRECTKKKVLWNKYKATGRYIDHLKYNAQNNKAVKVLREEKSKYEGKLIRNYKKIPKPFHRYMRLKQNTKATVRQLSKEDGSLTSSDAEAAELLQEFFTSVFTIEDITTAPDLQVKELSNEIENMLISKLEVIKALQKLQENKAPGVDGIHPKVLKRCCESLAFPLQLIFKKTLNEGHLPRDWRDANVTALHKKGSKAEVGNYRPVSLTSVRCKVLESLVRSRMLQHLKDNNLLRFTGSQLIDLVSLIC